MTDMTDDQVRALLERADRYATSIPTTDNYRFLLVSDLIAALRSTMTALAEAQAAQAGVVSSAFEAEAKAVHDEWVRAHQAGETPPRGEPDFSEAASDYAAAIRAAKEAQ